MKVMLIKDKKIDEEISIAKGQIFTVRPMKQTNLFGNTSHFYQIIDVKCPWLGEFLPVEYCLEQPKEKTYSEKEVKNIENYWGKEVKTLKFFVNTLADCLMSASEEIDRLRKDLEKAQ
jgi:hypothetical protein